MQDRWIGFCGSNVCKADSYDLSFTSSDSTANVHPCNTFEGKVPLWLGAVYLTIEPLGELRVGSSSIESIMTCWGLGKVRDESTHAGGRVVSGLQARYLLMNEGLDAKNTGLSDPLIVGEVSSDLRHGISYALVRFVWFTCLHHYTKACLMGSPTLLSVVLSTSTAQIIATMLHETAASHSVGERTLDCKVTSDILTPDLFF